MNGQVDDQILMMTFPNFFVAWNSKNSMVKKGGIVRQRLGSWKKTTRRYLTHLEVK